MNVPPPLPPDVKRLLGAASDLPGPTEAQTAGVFARVQATVGLAAPPAGGAAASGAAGSAKTIAIVAALGAVVIGGVAALVATKSGGQSPPAGAPAVAEATPSKERPATLEETASPAILGGTASAATAEATGSPAVARAIPSPATAGAPQSPEPAAALDPRPAAGSSRAPAGRNRPVAALAGKAAKDLSQPSRDAAAPAPHRPAEPAPGERGRVPTFERERALLDRARAALASGDVDAARSAVDEHAGAFPAGHLAEERDALRIKVFAAAGEREDAARAAQAFYRAYPRSLYRRAVAEALRSTETDPPASGQFRGRRNER